MRCCEISFYVFTASFLSAFFRRGYYEKTNFYRVLFYAVGLLVLALGLTLNTKTGLGVSPIISVAYSISQIFDHNFGNMTLALYSVFVVIEMILHLIRGRRYSRRADGALAHAGKRI